MESENCVGFMFGRRVREGLSWVTPESERITIQTSGEKHSRQKKQQIRS